MNYSKLSNEDLLTAYKNLDKYAFNVFFRRNSPIILSFLASKLYNSSDAEEALQDTFFRIHKYILRYDQSQNAMSWTFTIAKNCALDLIAKRRKAKEIRDEVEFRNELSEIDKEYALQAKDSLQELLSNLSSDERKLIEDRFLNEASYEQLAKTHNVSQAGVRQRISRLIKSIRDRS